MKPNIEKLKDSTPFPEIIQDFPNILNESQTETQKFQEFCMLYLKFSEETQKLLWELNKVAGLHDWCYESTDDHSVWKREQAKADTIKVLKKLCKDAGAEQEAQHLIWDHSGYEYDKPKK